MSPRFWAFSFYCICYNPTVLGGYNAQSKSTGHWQVKAAVSRIRDVAKDLNLVPIVTGVLGLSVINKHLTDQAAVRGLTPNIDNAPEILSKIKKLCPVDVPCQSNADLDGTRPECAVTAQVGNLLWFIFLCFFCFLFVNFGVPFRTLVPLHLLQSHCTRGQRAIWALSFYCTCSFFLWCRTPLNYLTKRMASTQLTT